MYDEAVSTFEYIVRQGRPVKEILHADYAFLNRTLATFYGIDARLERPADRSSASKARAIRPWRGVAARVGADHDLGAAADQPRQARRLDPEADPGNADAAAAGRCRNPAGGRQAFGGLTLRERLAQHKRDARCASCHLRIDPLGFPLEGFDAVGRRREAYADGKPIDLTGEFKDGTTIVGSHGLLTYLQSQDAKVMKTLSRKMLGYALGRNPQASDRPLIGEMVEAGGNASFSDLATRIVTSRQFRNPHAADRRGADSPEQVTRAGNP